ncbi:hypothetical protein ROZALSC1DRAFT_29316, partial [Rozella allomycis CSF55]
FKTWKKESLARNEDMDSVKPGTNGTDNEKKKISKNLSKATYIYIRQASYFIIGGICVWIWPTGNTNPNSFLFIMHCSIGTCQGLVNASIYVLVTRHKNLKK